MVKDADVLESAPGKCPKCGMELKPVRIVTAYTCLNNTAFIQAEPGKCRTNGSDLVPITASMFWVCPSAPDKHELNPGKCADGTDRLKRFEPRLHGDHNPRHGGQLFMADDAWHHIEGTYPTPGLFRVYFYDDWTRPLTPTGFNARLAVKNANGKVTATVPLQTSPIANAMEARIVDAALPLTTSLHVQFKAGEPEKLFDFGFKDYSRDPAAPATTAAPEPPTAAPPVAPQPEDSVKTAGAAPVTPAPPAPVADPQVLSPQIVIPVGTFQMQPIPAKTKDILVELNETTAELAEKIEHRPPPLGELWVPALRSKDLALALVNDHLNEIPARQRAGAETAAGRLTRAAYAIDNFGDLGDFPKILSAHQEFELAVKDLKAAYASIK
jgi:hypothetical protein